MWEIAVHLAFAGGVVIVSFCAVFFPRDVLDGILDLIESVSEGFLTYSCTKCSICFLHTVIPIGLLVLVVSGSFEYVLLFLHGQHYRLRMASPIVLWFPRLHSQNNLQPWPLCYQIADSS